MDETVSAEHFQKVGFSFKSSRGRHYYRKTCRRFILPTLMSLVLILCVTAVEFGLKIEIFTIGSHPFSQVAGEKLPQGWSITMEKENSKNSAKNYIAKHNVIMVV
jgi:hypothetical protein